MGFYYSDKPRREKAKEGWPGSPAENLERLKNAGVTSHRRVPMCTRCNRKYDISFDQRHKLYPNLLTGPCFRDLSSKSAIKQVRPIANEL